MFLLLLLVVMLAKLSDGIFVVHKSHNVADVSTVILTVYTRPEPTCLWPACVQEVRPSLRADLSRKQYRVWRSGIRFGRDAYSTYWVFKVPIAQGHRILDLPEFKRDRRTAFYAHGYIEDSDSQSVRTVVDAYLRRGDHNVVIVDWGVLAGGSPVVAALSTFSVGQALSKVLDGLYNAGYSPPLVHLIGHSMGGHVVGFAGKYATAAKISRITALDPVGIAFFALGNPHRLNKSDADFLDVIHTDASHYGVGIPIGHVDFYPNGGRRVQPGCPKPSGFLTPDDLCSHWLSWRLYSESLIETSPDRLLFGKRCGSWKEFKDGKCVTDTVNDTYSIIRFGYDTPPQARGVYYLRTNSAPPYGRGLSGIS